MNINFFGFAATCTILYAVTYFLAWYFYDNEKFAPCTIFAASMAMTAFVTACLVYVTMIVFGG